MLPRTVGMNRTVIPCGHDSDDKGTAMKDKKKRAAGGGGGGGGGGFLRRLVNPIEGASKRAVSTIRTHTSD